MRMTWLLSSFLLSTSKEIYRRREEELVVDEMKETTIERTAKSREGHRKVEIRTMTESAAQDSRRITRMGSARSHGEV
jgi:hypothetical protein